MRLNSTWTAFLLLILLVGCRSSAPAQGELTSGAAAAAAAPETAAPLYLRSSIFQEKDRHRTTNYRRGVLVPVNTEVALVSKDARRIVVQVKSTGRALEIENVPKHTGESTEQAFRRLFATEPVDLSGFSEAERQAILLGKAEVGMSKEAVLAALGNPPAIGTPTLDAPEWKYWDSRFTTFVVQFGADGRVMKVGRR